MGHMKTILSGLLTVIVVGAIALLILRSRGLVKLPTDTTPSPSPVASANFEYESPLPTSSPKSSPKPSAKPTSTPTSETKGGVKGVSTTYVPKTTTTTTTTTTVSHVKLTLMDSNKCPTTTTTEIRDISGNLTVKYSLTDNYTANVTAWKENGEELLKQTRIEDSGDLFTISGVSYAKLQIQSDHCVKNDEHWITVTAER